MMKKVTALIIGMMFYGTTTLNVFSEGDVENIDLNLRLDEMAISFFDLSNGEASLIQNSKGDTILINTGAETSLEELQALLEMNDVIKINKLIVTNHEPEYDGNVKWLLSHYVVEELISAISTIPSYHQFVNAKTMTTGWQSGELYELFPGFIVKVLHHHENGSLSLSFSYGHNRVLYMGIAEEEIEMKLIQKHPMKSEILKVGEFAAQGGTSQAFLEKVDPQMAVIFRKNKALPSSDVIERLNETWIDTYQTKQFGTIIIRCTTEDYEVITIPSK
jgi:competence protein ComEC